MMGPIGIGDLVLVTVAGSWTNTKGKVLGPAPSHLGGWIVQVAGEQERGAPWPPMVFQTDELESL